MTDQGGRSREGGWTGLSTTPPPQDPFAGLAAADVAYDGTADADGSPGHRLRIADPVGAFTRAMGVTSPSGMGEIEVAASTFEVLVDGAGHPSSATFTLRGTSAPAGEFQVAMAYTFRDWGAAFSIEAPIEIPPTAPPGPGAPRPPRLPSSSPRGRRGRRRGRRRSSPGRRP